MVISFVCWAMSSFDGQFFAICGTSVGALRRNIVPLIFEHLSDYFSLSENKGENYIEVKGETGKNRMYLFGGNDARSASKIQGMTLAGVFFDEVALMPEAFVEQATGRCSVDGAKSGLTVTPSTRSTGSTRSGLKDPGQPETAHLHFTCR